MNSACAMQHKPQTKKCQHKDFGVEARVEEVHNPQDVLVGRQLVVRVVCKECGAPFHFVGVPVVNASNAVDARGPIAADKATTLQIGIEKGSFAPNLN